MNSQATYRLRKVMLIGFLLFLSIQLSANETDSTSRLSWFDRVDEWYTANMNYGTITALMAAESSIFPVPSELVVPPAAFIASRGDGGMKMIPAGFSKMNYFVFSVFTLLGAGLWNCILAFLGRLANGQQEVIYRYSHEIGYGLLAIVCLVIVFFTIKYFVGKSKRTNI